jgi:hypothetical protein
MNTSESHIRLSQAQRQVYFKVLRDFTCRCVSSPWCQSPQENHVVTHFWGASGRRTPAGTRYQILPDPLAPLSRHTTEPWHPLAECEDVPGHPDSGAACPPWCRCCETSGLLDKNLFIFTDINHNILHILYFSILLHSFSIEYLFFCPSM